MAHRIRSAVLLGIVAAVAAGAPARAQDAPTDPATELLERHAPHVAVRTHTTVCGDGERYLPMTVDAVLGRDDVVLRDADGDIVATAPTAETLAGGDEDLWLDLPGDALDPGCSYEKWFRGLDAAPSIYGRVVQEGDMVVAQYWLYWAFNQWNDVHESDWEMAQVMFEADSIEAALDAEPAQYAYAQHEGSQFAIPGDGDEVLIVDGTHPVVFSGQGSHASYFAPSVWFGSSAATGVGCDDTSSPVEILAPALVVLPAGDDPPTSGEFAWLSYRGHWGEQHPAFADGPTGPVMKQQWSEPVTWVDESGRGAAVQIPFAGSPTSDAFCHLTAWGSTLVNRALDDPWLILGGAAVVLTALALVVLRSSQGVLTQALRTTWRVRRELVPAGAIVAAGVVGAHALQWVLLRVTPVGTLTDLLGSSSPWVAPLINATQALVLVPAFAWAATITLATVRPDVVAGPGAPRRSRKVRTFWILLALTVIFAVAIFVFWPLVLLPSRFLVAPVVASRHRGSLTGALSGSSRLVRGHWLRSIGLLLTMGLIASAAIAVGAVVLLLTSLTFVEAGLITGGIAVFLVPYLAMVLVEYHAVLVAAHGGEEEVEIAELDPAPTPAPA